MGDERRGRTRKTQLAEGEVAVRHRLAQCGHGGAGDAGATQIQLVDVDGRVLHGGDQCFQTLVADGVVCDRRWKQDLLTRPRSVIWNMCRSMSCFSARMPRDVMALSG